MKFIALLTCVWPVAVLAQANVDKPVPVGPNDTVFVSAADANAAYVIPATLMVLGEPRFSEMDGKIIAHFEVGMNAQQYNEVSAKVAPLQLRTMRGWNAAIDPQGSTNTPAKFRGRLIPLGDPGNLGAPLAYVFTVKKIGPRLGRESKALMESLFRADGARHLGTVLYEFNAISGGHTYQARTAVGIFAPAAKAGLTVNNLAASAGAAAEIPPLTASAADVTFDAAHPCWDNVKIGQICLK